MALVSFGWLGLALAGAFQEPARAAAIEAQTYRGRIVDVTTGLPVAGVTCELWTEEYERPARLAEVVRSDAGGRFELHQAFADEGKVRFRHPGYASATESPEDDALVELWPRQEPLVVRVLDLEGNPIAGARVRSHQTCRHAPAAVEAVGDATGRVVLDGAPPQPSTDYEVRAPAHGALVPFYLEEERAETVVYLPRRAPVALRILDAGGSALAHHRFLQQGPGPTVVVTDAEGRAVLDSLYESREIGLLDAAKALAPIFVAAPPLAGECIVSPGLELAAPEAAEWPLLRIVEGPRAWRLHVEFGADSVTRHPPRFPLEVRVRPGVPVVVLSQGDEVRRARLAPWSGERELDLTLPETLVVPRFEPGELVELAFRVRTPEGAPLAVESRLGWSSEPPPDEDPSADGVRYRVPRGSRYAVRFRAEGFFPIARAGLAEPREEAEVVRLRRE